MREARFEKEMLRLDTDVRWYAWRGRSRLELPVGDGRVAVAGWRLGLDRCVKGVELGRGEGEVAELNDRLEWKGRTKPFCRYRIAVS